MITIQRRLQEESFEVLMVKLCAALEWPSVACHRPSKTALSGQSDFGRAIKVHIEKEPSFGYRTVVGLLGMKKNTVQHTFQFKSWQVHKRAGGHRPRIQAQPPAATDQC